MRLIEIPYAAICFSRSSTKFWDFFHKTRLLDQSRIEGRDSIAINSDSICVVYLGTKGEGDMVELADGTRLALNIGAKFPGLFRFVEVVDYGG